MEQLHKRYSEEHVRELLERYERGEVKRTAIEEVLGIGRSRFFELLEWHRAKVVLWCQNRNCGRGLSSNVEEAMRSVLDLDKTLIETPDIPVWRYNYSYVREELRRKYGIKVSVPTIISRAKEWGYYKARRKHTPHTREVISNYTGELIQHDSSHHLFAPMGGKKWYLITSIDDYSRYILEARFMEVETTNEHIKSLERVFTKHGLPASYYTDSHSIFRYVAGRDNLHYESHIDTDRAQTQWLQVLNDCRVKALYALSPQAKGKVERPYQWIQDHVVRSCVRDGVIDIKDGQDILNEEIKAYNFKRVHSTTREVPYYRYKKAKEEKSLWRSFEVPSPFKSTKDIFCTRLNRKADGYRTLTLNRTKLRVNGVNPYDDIEIRIYRQNEEVSELRFWRKEELLDVQKLKNRDISLTA